MNQKKNNIEINIKNLISELRSESARPHQEYGLSQYLVLKQDMNKLKQLASKAALLLEQQDN